MTDDLAAHLANRYGIAVEQLVELDAGVFRVERRDGPSWVARVFPDRAVEDLEDDATILRALAAGGFPAERCATDDTDSPVSQLGAASVLVTGWVDGTRSDGRGRTFGVLGALLGGLHSRPAASLRAGGAWHHLSQHGGPRAEIDAAIELLERTEHLVRPEQHPLYDLIRDALECLDACDDLPHAFVHPDFVPANAITTPGDGRVMVDWTGAGRGPRLWSLAFLLYAGGVRDLRLVDAAATRYATRSSIDEAEAARLAAVIPARALTIDVWSFCHGRLGLREVAARWKHNGEAAKQISDRALAALGH